MADGSDLLGQPVALTVDNAVRIHRLGDIAVQALRGVSLQINPGEFVALMGPSGSGKSTLLSLLGGLDRPTGGSIDASGLRLDQLGDRALADYRLQRVGTIFQTFNLVATQTARDNVALPMALAGVPEKQRRARADSLLGVVGLGDRAGFRPSRLSGGEQQRVAVARALANRPGLLLADEPTGNLDSAAGARVLELIEELNHRGATVVMVTHDGEVAARARRIITLKDGQIVSDAGERAPARAAQPEPGRPPRRLALLESMRLGSGNLLRRKLRTGLSSSGVAIGIGTMALIIALATGIQTSFVDAFAQAGQLANVQVSHNFSEPDKDKPFSQASLDQLGRLSHVSLAYGSVSIQGSVESPGAGGHTAGLFSSGPVSQTPAIAKKFLAAGRYPTADSAAEALILTDGAKKFGWSNQGAIGKTLTFTGAYNGTFTPGGAAASNSPLPLTLTIVGVSSSVGGGFGPLTVVVPYRTATAYWDKLAAANDWRSDEFSGITLVADSIPNADRVRDEAKKAGFNAQSANDFIKQIQQFLTFLGIGLSALAALALVVACLGIANTMYTAVLERTREIGLLKALGARSGDVRNMFTAEAALIGALGGAMGILITWGLTLVGNAVVNNLAKQQGIGLEINVFQMTPLLIVAAILLAALFSGLSGLLPAIRASRLNPVTALRYE